MKKRIISISLIIIFLGLIVAPTVITVLDDSIDISIFYSLAEEEEKGSEKTKIFEVLFINDQNQETNFSSALVHNQVYFFKKYPKPHLNLISPPPEFHIL